MKICYPFCMRDKAKFNQYLKDYRRTPKGKASQIWSALLQRVENKSGKSPAYTCVKLLMRRDEFLLWAVPELEKWIANKPIESVSLDRIREDGHYELSNIQFLTRIENILKQRRYKNVNAPEGKAWCSKCKDYLTLDKFAKDRYNHHGLTNICITHRKERDRKRYLRLTNQ